MLLVKRLPIVSTLFYFVFQIVAIDSLKIEVKLMFQNNMWGLYYDHL